MSNRKAISRKEIDSRWFFWGRAGTGNEVTQRPLRTHRLALFLLLPLLLFFFLLLHITRHTLSCSLSLSLSFSLLHSTAFIIKIKCKIVPRTSFPNGIKLRAALFPYAITILVEGSILRLDHVVPLHTIVPSRANEQAVIYFI